MLNYDTLIVSELKADTGLEVYYELFCDPNTQKPCITYLETDDYQDLTGDTLGYSNVQYTIKIWGDDLSVLSPYFLKIDETMRRLGFVRRSTAQLTANQQICKIFIYRALAQEEFND